MNNILEVARQNHEDIEKLEKSSVHQLLQKARTHKDQVVQEQRVAEFILKIAQKSKELIKIYTDDDELFKQERLKMTTEDFTEYYDSLKSIKEFYKRLPSQIAAPFDANEFLKDPDVEMQELESRFTGEEGYARHLDLHALFLEYLNIKNVNKMNYLTYLDRFERFKDIPIEVKKTARYSKYLMNMFEYLSTWIRRCQPLFNIEKLENDASQEFENLWHKDEVPNWKMPEIEVESSLYCRACDKTFTNESVFEAHKTGKKHLKGLKLLEQKMDVDVDVEKAIRNSQIQEYQSLKSIAKLEFQIRKYVSHLSVIREDTKSHIERKQALTDKERVFFLN